MCVREMEQAEDEEFHLSEERPQLLIHPPRAFQRVPALPRWPIVLIQ